MGMGSMRGGSLGRADVKFVKLFGQGMGRRRNLLATGGANWGTREKTKKRV